MKLTQFPSPNFDTRKSVPVDMLVLHYTGMQTGEEALDRLRGVEAKVSAHYLVYEDGQVFQLVDETERAWHAGLASWRGQSNINARSIGIEIVNPGHEWGYRPFPKVQMTSVAALSQDILKRHRIPARNVVGHSDVAPARKQDPGELFNWAWLAEQGVGLYPKGFTGSPESASAWPVVSQKLSDYGYDVDSASEKELILAFQRHFRHEAVNGAWDSECEARLNWLLAHCDKH